MGNWFSDAVNTVVDTFTAPINDVVDMAKGMANTATGLWDDYTGKTAAKMAAAQADKNTAAQLAWNREIAETAHQKEVADLEAAGINKIFTANGNGAQALPLTPQQSDFSSIGRRGIADLISIGSNAYGAIKGATTASAAQKANENLIKADIDLKRAAAAKTIADTDLLPTTKKQLQSEIKLNSARTVREQNEATKLAAAATKEVIESEIKGKDLKYYELSAIVNHAEKISALWAGGYMTRKIATKLIKTFAKKTIDKGTKSLPNYIIKRGKDYVNLKTGEILN